jgi:MHS family metabolite:H+ symporter-like MFS transporter
MKVQPQRTTSDLVKAAVSGWLAPRWSLWIFSFTRWVPRWSSEIFFPEQSAAMALILAMGTYGAGYIARIVGAFIFGRMGDSIGRKKVLFITITMMGICTTLIGVCQPMRRSGFCTCSAGDAAYSRGWGPGRKSGAEPCWRSTRRKENAASSPRWWRWAPTAER